MLGGLAALVLAVGVACSGGAPGTPYPSIAGVGVTSLPSGQSATITMPQATGLGVGTVGVTGTGTVSATQSAGNPSGVPALQLAQRSLTGGARRDESANTPVAYVAVTASTASTISLTVLNVAPTTAFPSGTYHLAFWNGSQWVTTGSAANVSSSGVITVASSIFNPPISLAAGASLYLAVYTGQIFATPTPEPSPPVSSPNPVSMALFSVTTIDVVTNPGLTVTATSSNTSIATVTASATAAPNGQAPFTVDGNAPGTATLTFTDPVGQKTTDIVAVSNTLPSPKPSPGAFVISADDSTTVTVSTVSTQSLTITATSSNTSVATVTSSAASSGGFATFTVRGVASGVATLTFTDPFGDTDIATVDVSPIQDGTFASGFNNPSGAAVWQPCSYSRTSLTAAINPSPPPFSTGNQAPPASTAPLAASVVDNDTAVVTPPPDLNPNAGATTVPTAIPSTVALVGGSPAPSGGEMASVTEGAVGICQTITLDSTNPYLSFWVYEVSGASNFEDGDQEAAVLSAPNGTLFNATTPNDSYLFAELNCFVDPGVIGLSTFGTTNTCIPAAYGGTGTSARYQGGYWVQRGPYNMTNYANVGSPFTLYFGAWYFETKAYPATFGMAMFIANVQMTNSSTFPASGPYNRHRGITLALPKDRAQSAMAAKARP